MSAKKAYLVELPEVGNYLDTEGSRTMQSNICLLLGLHICPTVKTNTVASPLICPTQQLQQPVKEQKFLIKYGTALLPWKENTGILDAQVLECFLFGMQPKCLLKRECIKYNIVT